MQEGNVLLVRFITGLATVSSRLCIRVVVDIMESFLFTVALRANNHVHFRRAASSGLGRGSGQLSRSDAKAVAVAEEEDTFALALGLRAGLDPVAGAGASPHALKEADGAAFGVRAIMFAHDGLDGF